MLEPIAATAVRYAILIVVLVAALGQLGVQTTSLLTVLGAAGLAIGLALQGTLANIAAGIMLLYLRPFRAGDTIETPLIIGKVREIGLFATIMETLDGLFYFVPNSALWNVPLKNQTRNPRRLVTVTLSVSYSADLGEVRRILAEMASADERVLKDPAPSVSVESYTENRIVVALRAWTRTDAFVRCPACLRRGCETPADGSRRQDACVTARRGRSRLRLWRVRRRADGDSAPGGRTDEITPPAAPRSETVQGQAPG